MANRPTNCTRRHSLGILAAGFVLPTFSAFAQASEILVHKDPDCGCCTGWAQHLKEARFTVTVDESVDLQAVRKRLRVPRDLAACHTGEIADYVIEGHVPAMAIRRLLETRPKAFGLAVPGMPAGSPGMEGGAPREYDVVLFSGTAREPFMRFVGTKPTN